MKNRTIILLFVFTIVLLLVACAQDPSTCAHEDTEKVKKEATCLGAEGWEVTCNDCGSRWFDETAPKLEHSPGDWETSVMPTCTTVGEEVRICQECNETVERRELEATGHNEEWEITVKADCMNTGKRLKKCLNCRIVLSTEEIPVTHVPVTVEAVAPTCSSVGYVEYVKCSECLTPLTERTPIEKLPHTPTSMNGVDPTCSSVGYTAGEQCSVCKIWTSGHDQIEKLAHTTTDTSRVEPTCTESGIEAGSICTVCNATVSGREPIRALGHHFPSVLSNVCSRCPEKEYYEINSYELFYKGYSDKSGAIIYLNEFILDSDTTPYVITLGSEQSYLRLVGDADRTYSIRIVIDERETRIDIDFVNINLSSDYSIISSESDAYVDLGFYGEKCSLICNKAKTGERGERGSDGAPAINVVGDLQISLHTFDCTIKGGDGGDGGQGKDGWGWNGGDGGDGGDGASAAIAKSVSVHLYDGTLRENIILSAGYGGKGGDGGIAYSIAGTEGSPMYDDGKPGNDGKDAELATSPLPSFQINSGK